jgi:hypothetical protein
MAVVTGSFVLARRYARAMVPLTQEFVRVVGSQVSPNPSANMGDNVPAEDGTALPCGSEKAAKLIVPTLSGEGLMPTTQNLQSDVDSVHRWSVGVTTAPRRRPTLDRCLASLVQAGWSDVRVFAEPGTEIADAFAHLPVTLRDSVLGAFPNWYLSLAELVMREPRADAYFLCQDDALLSSGLRGYLERTLWPAADVGVVSVYCPSHYAIGRPAGFHVENRGWASWGAVAYLFPNPSARAVLTDLAVLNHRPHGPAEGMRNIDSVVGSFCQRKGLGYYVHVPSLSQHIGDTSTIWRYGSARGRRRADRFLPELDR